MLSVNHIQFMELIDMIEIEIDMDKIPNNIGKMNGKIRVTVTKVIPIMVDSFLGIGTRHPKLNLINWHP